MKILVTGSAGFIGSELCIKLLEKGNTVIGIDNHNDYYDTNLKEARLARHLSHSKYTHLRLDIANRESLEAAFIDHQPKFVVNLAAQAGVRYSMENPHAYLQSNVVGFFNILQCCQENKIEHLVYASSSSVYGGNTALPFALKDNVDHPLSLYAASKKTNELMAHTSSHLYDLPTTGLRFFTVYGPWGRPDMALFKFTKSILAGEKIQVYNYGNHRRDFTYIDDVVEVIMRVVACPAKPNPNWSGSIPDPSTSLAPWRVYNIGNNNTIDLMSFIRVLENVIGKKANIEKLPLQPGDVKDTHADVSALVKDFNYEPDIDISDGIKRFINWYNAYYDV